MDRPIHLRDTKIHFKMDLKISLEQNSANLTLKENMTL